MNKLKLLAASVLIGGTALASVATFSKAGAQSIEHPNGISLREASAKSDRSGLFFPYYMRSHRGGGLRGGK